MGEISGAAVIAIAGLLVAAVLLWGLLRSRRRARLAAARLDRLHRLTEDLASVVDAEDPDRAVRDLTARATAGLEGGPADSAAFLCAVADLSAQALQRVGHVRSEREAIAHVEFLARASAALGASLDAAQVVSTVEALAVPYLADTCWMRLASERADPSPPDEGIFRVPLRAADTVIGELAIQRRGRPTTAAEQRAAELLADRAAQALDHALLFTEQARTSSTLEHSLLPAATLPIEHLQVATRYLAAAEGQAVGGDFYDVLSTPSGSAVLIIGDVQGKGVEAATLTATARHTLRAAALEGAGPAGMLGRLNDALLYGSAERALASPEPAVRFVTVSIVALTPNDSGFGAVVANGGHPPPLVIRPDGAVEHLLADGPLLGVFDDPCFPERAIQLDLSDILVLYTDGVTEQRRQADLFDEAQLGRLVRNMLTIQHADDVAQIILDTAVVLNPREVRDDIALVVARVTGPR